MMSLVGHAVGAAVATLTPLPALYGMLVVPAVAGNLDIRELEVLSLLRGDTAALIVFASMGVFIARAGIDVELLLLQSSSGMVLALGFLPLFAETAFVTVAASQALDISWRWAFLLGSLTAPMSPLVVMWTALNLRRKELGSGGSVCSLLLVVSALDSAAAFCIFGVALKCAMDAESWASIAMAVFQLPSGILIGAVIGFMSIYVPNEYNVHATFYRVEMLLAVNVCSVIAFHYFLGMPAVGYLSAFTTACVASNGWKTLSMDANKNTLRTMMSLSWLIMQPLAMSIVGPHIYVSRLGGWRQLRFIGVLLCGVAVRMVVSVLCCVKSKRRWAERLFICIACVPKGTVQLLTCSWTLLRGFPDDDAGGDAGGQAMAQMVLDCCVYALLVTGPLGTLLSSSLAPRLLRKSGEEEAPSENHQGNHPDMSF
ncbi:sodium/hydrogen exchanger 9B2-like [Thrips palmi]|uniref:Sodium/hydrogen exchanger 9B2-like n=1 Tax=Thrips palmi TaxID=161013 RepID=A0A6P8YYH3_THRPL|nr:sodium/hydrogen exchanger 9B2-like [Thrips palmi]